MASSMIAERVSVLLLVLTISAIGLLIYHEPEPTAFAIVETASVDGSIYDLLDSEDEVRVVVIYRENARDRGMRILSERLPDRRFASRIAPHIVTRSDLNALVSDPAIERIIPDVRVSSMLATSRGIINADDAWGVAVDGVGLSGAGTTVCVIDTGVDYTHPSLGGCTSGSFLAGTCSKVIGGYDFVNLDSDPWDDDGHGTHVAGIIAANGTVTGVAPGARIVAIKSLDENGGGWLSDTMLGIEWCTNNRDAYNISVISMSLGSDQRYMSECDGVVSEWAQIIDAAIDQNMSVVSATGNTASVTSIAYPACVNASMRIGATTSADAIASFTNRAASFPDIILAPGVSITSTMPGGGSAAMSGTSMATPHVSGVIALLNEYLAFDDREALPIAIRDAIIDTGLAVYDADKSNETYHRIDAYELIRSFDERSPTIVTTYDEPIPGASWTLTWNVTDDFSVDDVSVRLTTPDDLIERSETQGSITINPLLLGAYSFAIEANDTRGNEANTSGSFFVRIDPEYELLIDGGAANRSYYGANDVSINVTLTMGDTIELFIDDVFIDASNATIGYGSLFDESGVFSVSVRHNETDAYFASERSYTVTIFDEAPAIASRTPVAPEVSIDETDSVLFAVEALAPEPDEIAYVWTVNGTASGSEANLTVDGMMLDPGVYPIDVVVTYNGSQKIEGWNLTIDAVPPSVVENPQSGAIELAHDDVRSFGASATDVKDRALSYVWVYGAAGISITNTTQLNASLIDSGTLTLTVSNGYAQSVRTWDVTVFAEPIPLEATDLIPDQGWDEGSSVTIPLSDHFSVLEGVSFALETAMPVTMSVSDGAARLSASSSYVGSGTARIGAQRGSDAAQSNEFSITIDPAPASSGGGGGGGGGGGSSWSPPPSEPEPEPELIEVASADPVGSFESIEARLVEPSRGSRVQVRLLNETPQDVEPFRGRVYATAEITVDDAVEEVAFSFTVPFAWIESERVEPDAIELHRFTTGWEPLETALIGFADGSYRYRAIAPGLSVFVIGVQERADPVAIVTDAPLYAFPGSWKEELVLPDQPRPVPFALVITPLVLVMFVIFMGRKYSDFSS